VDIWGLIRLIDNANTTMYVCMYIIICFDGSNQRRKSKIEVEAKKCNEKEEKPVVGVIIGGA
jgi:hypothetical protein